ncbi:MAG: hypothetical protein WC852_06255 [Candidatus Nanoarchaeia archaeon]|jgi:hypothetical protein
MERLEQLALGSFIVFLSGVAGLAGYSTGKQVCEERAAQNKLQVQTANVLGAEAPEKFYDIDGQRVFLEVDGKPVAEYVKGRQ